MKKFIGMFVIITIISIIGYLLLFYGGHKSEEEGSRNIYLILGEILMWPWFVVNLIQKYITVKNSNIEFAMFWIVQYAGYLLLFYFTEKIKSGVLTRDKR